ILFFEFAKEQRVDKRSRDPPTLLGSFATLLLREGLQIAGDLLGQQPPVLIPAVVRLALDVQNNPAGLRVAIPWPMPLHSERIRSVLAVARSCLRDRPGDNRERNGNGQNEGSLHGNLADGRKLLVAKERGLSYHAASTSQTPRLEFPLGL